MDRPVIGMTARRRNPATDDDRLQAPVYGLEAPYVHAVLAAGGAPLLLPRTDDREALAALVDRLDGLLLPGAGDIVSLTFGEEPHPAQRYVDPVLDEMEMTVCALADEQDLPVLGICRGLQVINVARGGTLVQDIPTEVPGAVQHWATKPREPSPVHTVDVEPGTLLARVWEKDRAAVNSYHHQAPKDVGRGLRASARSRDGVIEALEADDGRPVLGVQWHPEEGAEREPLYPKLFAWLVGEARARATSTHREPVPPTKEASGHAD